MNEYKSLRGQEFEPLYSEMQENTYNKRRNVRKIGGLSVVSTTLFIAGEMAGSGVLALPRAIVNSGFIGLLLLVVFCGNAAYGGIKLGDCWALVEERFPEHRNRTRNPYSIIALKAVGKIGSVVVSHCIRFTLFGAGTVYLLLSSQIIQEILSNIFPATACTYFIIIAVCLIPPMWLGTPKEFSLVGIGAILTTVLACLLFFFQIVLDGANNPNREVVHKVHDFHDFFLSFGTLLFAFGGASTFPTIQNDMENKRHFSKSVIIAFTIIMILYMPITAGGFYVYGEDVAANITLSLSKTIFVFVGNILMAAHLIFAFLIVMNPVCQELEESFQIPRYFNWKRCVLRTCVVLIMIAIGESIPKFGKILSLVGGSTITLLTFVFPPYFYMKLCDQHSPDWETRHISLHEKVYMWELIFIGITGGAASTYNAINAIFGYSTFTRPCYWSN